MLRSTSVPHLDDKVSSFTHLKIMEGSQNSEIRPMDPTTPPLGFLSSVKWDQGLPVYQILNF